MEDKKKEKFEEQKAPLKNDDNAYVRVGKNGEPVFPEPAEKKTVQQKKAGDPTTIGKR